MLGLLGALSIFIKVGLFVARPVPSGALGVPRPLLLAPDALAGLLALFGVAAAGRHGRAPLVLGVTGVTSLASDLTWASLPPRMIPGTLLLAAGLVARNEQRERKERPAPGLQGPLPRGAGWVAVILHLGTGILYVPAGLVAPAYGVLVLWAMWGALFAFALRLRKSNPWLAFVPPIAAVAAFFLVLTLGARLFGWRP